ncbi:MAG: TolC family protein [Myxococcaceae bacterium]
MIAAMVVALSLSAEPATLTLEQVREMSRRQLDAVKAEYDVTRANENVRTARSAILPQLIGNAGVGYNWSGPQVYYAQVPTIDPATGRLSGFTLKAEDIPVNTDRETFQLGLTLNQLLYDGGKWWNQISQAGASKEAAEGQLAEQRLAAEFEAVRRFYELYKAQVTLDVLNASVTRSQQQLERAKSLYEAGRGQRRDALDADVNLGNDRIAAIRQQQTITAASGDLLAWLGQPMSNVRAANPGTLDPKLQSAEPPPDPDAIAFAREHRPLLASLAAAQRSAERSIDVANSNYLPQVSATAGYTRYSPVAKPFFTDPSRQNNLNVGLNLNWNLFNGLSTDSAAKTAEANASQARIQLEYAQRQMEVDVAKAAASVRVQQQVIAVAQANYETAKQVVTLSSERFNAGAGSTLDVRDAELKLTQAELSLVQGRIDLEEARAALDRMTGAAMQNKEKAP